MDIQPNAKKWHRISLRKSHQRWATLFTDWNSPTIPVHRFDVPEDGLPSIDDWITTFTSIVLDGLDLGREPLDVCVRSSNLSTNKSLHNYIVVNLHSSHFDTCLAGCSFATLSHMKIWYLFSVDFPPCFNPCSPRSISNLPVTWLKFVPWLIHTSWFNTKNDRRHEQLEQFETHEAFVEVVKRLKSPVQSQGLHVSSSIIKLIVDSSINMV